MSTTISAAALRTLHRLHGQLVDLRGRLGRGPKQVAAHVAGVKQLAEQVAQAQQRVKEARLAADRKQLDIKDSEAKIAHWEVQLNTAGSNKEFQALQEQIAAGKMAASVLEDETLELLSRVDELQQQVVDAEQHLAKGEEDLLKVQQHVEANSATLRAEIERLEGDLVVAEKELPGDFKQDYQRVVRQLGAEGLAPVEDQVCQGCGGQITLNMQSDLALSKPVFCKSCGCLLYLPE